MQFVAIVRLLWNRRLLVAIGLAVAIVLGMLMAFKVSGGLPPTFSGRQYQVGIASAGVLVDSPSSQVIDLSGGQSKADVVSLSGRARLLANLMATSPLKDQIARRAGVSPDAMIADAPTDGLPSKPSPLATGATKVSASDPDANVLTVYVNEALPIITADVQAPTPVIAARIASAAISELQLYLKSVAAADRVPDARQLVVKPLGPARSAAVHRGPRKLFAILAFIFVFGSWCAGIVLSCGLARSWREVSAAETLAPNPTAALAPERPESGLAPAPPRPPRKPPIPPGARPDLSEHPERPRRVA